MWYDVYCTYLDKLTHLVNGQCAFLMLNTEIPDTVNYLYYKELYSLISIG